MASLYVLVMGSIIGAIAWIFLAFKVPGVPFGRTLGIFGCAVLTLVFAVLSPAEAFASINIETIALLFGTMVISVLLEREGFFSVFIHFLTYRCTSAFSLLARICCASAFLSALMTNDTVCVFFTPVIIDLCELHQLPHGPFLVALATSANIGSTATPVGNPQNMIIASLSGISYGQFILYIGPAMVVALALNIALLALWYGKELRGKEIKICKGRFVRATEEEMEAKLGKDWEKEVAMEAEKEQRRIQRREREKKQTEVKATPPPVGEEGEEGVEMDEVEGIKRRKGGDAPHWDEADAEEVKTDYATADEHRVDFIDDHSTTSAVTGAAQQAEVMVRHGLQDEEVKREEDEEKAQDAVRQEGRSTIPALSERSSMSSGSTAPLLHSDSVALLIYQLQMEHRAVLQQEDKSIKAPPVHADGAEDDLEAMKRRRTRTSRRRSTASPQVRSCPHSTAT